MSELEMPQFTRRNPHLSDAVLRQMLEYTHQFETELQAIMAKAEEAERQQQRQRPPPSGSTTGKSSQEGEAAAGEGSAVEQSQDESEGQAGSQLDVQEQLESGEQGKAGEDPEFEVELQCEDAGEGEGRESDEERRQREINEAADEVAEKLAEKFEEEMAPVVDSIGEALEHFGPGLDDLLGKKNGWNLSQGLWQKSGWREFKKLRRKLEQLKELRDLVRELGRGGGKGPIRRAPEEVYASRSHPGVVRSALVPEQVQGLFKSGNIMQVLPSEAALLAAGRRERASSTARTTKMLFYARLAEKTLLSYERAGWLEDEPARVTRRMEMRPSGELGPIIVCLDTSGSMFGAREVIAKSLVLECMRGAKKQSRMCYIYAFSGTSQVRELDLSNPAEGLGTLLTFLESSFGGGTDVDRPLELALGRVQNEGWELADILMVTDGEIPKPKPALFGKLHRCHEDLGLEVHGLLVGPDVTPPMKQLCNHVHVFKSWSALGVTSSGYGW